MGSLERALVTTKRASAGSADTQECPACSSCHAKLRETHSSVVTENGGCSGVGGLRWWEGGITEPWGALVGVEPFTVLIVMSVF